jgi:hypothetical protein
LEDVPVVASPEFVPKIRGRLFEPYKRNKEPDIGMVYGNEEHQAIINLLGKDDDDL